MRALAIVALLLLAGCLSSTEPGPAADDAPAAPPQAAPPPAPPMTVATATPASASRTVADILVNPSCRAPGTLGLSGCNEPTLAGGSGMPYFYSDGSGLYIGRSDDGSNWTSLALPSHATSTGATWGDALVQIDPDGRLWWSALNLENSNVVVARSDDLGDSWALVRGIGYAPVDQSPAAADRQWLGFHPDGRILMLCNCPALTVPMLAWSEDDGATWTITHAPDLVNHAGPPGPPMFLEDGTLLIPFIERIQAGPGAGVFASIGRQREDGGFDVIRLTEQGDSLTCCAWPNLATDAEGRIWFAFASGDRPMLAWSDDGTTWSTPSPVPGPGDIAYPHPAIAAWQDGLAMTWFDGDSAQHFLSLIHDNGTVEHIRVGSASAPHSDYNDVLVDGGQVLMPWVESLQDHLTIVTTGA